MGREDDINAYIDSWKLGHYSEEVPLAKEFKEPKEKQVLLKVLVARLKEAKGWKQYLSYFAAGASIYYKNPSFAAFFEDPIVRKEIIRHMGEAGVPKVTEVEGELFDVFAGNVEHNVDVHEEFVKALFGCLEKTKSYNELYNDYLTNYFRLYFNTLKISNREMKLCRELVLKKIDTWGKPKADQETSFYNIIESFEIPTHDVTQETEERKEKSFLFFTKKIQMKVNKRTPKDFDFLVNALRELH